MKNEYIGHPSSFQFSFRLNLLGISRKQSQNKISFSSHFIMLTKTPVPARKRIIGSTLKAVFVAEACAIAVSYGLYFKLNTDREFRLYMYKNHNWILEGYYGLGERLGGLKTRDLDFKVWTNEGKI